MEFVDRKEFSGSVLKQANEVFEYMNLFNKTKGEIVGLERIDTKDYPEYALREALLNAIIHRDYNYKGSILISFFDDRVEFTSLGGLIKGLEIKDLYYGVSESRNPNLANIFYRLKYVESFGTGIERIFESYKDFSKKPELLDSNNIFKVVLYNRNYVDSEENINSYIDKSDNREEKIIDYLDKNEKINRKTVEKLFDVSKTRATNILNKMINEKLLIKTGSGKNVFYKLK